MKRWRDDRNAVRDEITTALKEYRAHGQIFTHITDEDEQDFEWVDE